MGLTKAMMRSEPSLWRSLLERLAEIAAASLKAQVDAGASAVQVFDSWVGSLSARDYATHVLPSVARLFEQSAELGVPRIYFGLGTGHLLESMATAGAGRGRPGLADPARTGAPQASRGRRPSGQPRSDCLPGGPSPRSNARSAWSSPKRRPRATSSTSATGCCQKPIPACSTHLAQLVRSRGAQEAQ